MAHWSEPAILIATKAQWAFVAKELGIAGLQSLVKQATAGSWAGSFAFPSPSTEMYVSVGDQFDVRHNTATVGVYIVPSANVAPPTGAPLLPPVDPAPPPGGIPQTPGLPASPLPQVGGPLVNPQIAIGIWKLIRAAIATTGSVAGRFGGGGNLLQKALGLIGGLSILDWLLDGGADDDTARMMEDFVKVLSEMESIGMIHPYTPGRRATAQGGVDPGPVFFIFNMENIQGWYTSFHMSRSGLQAHDDDQDTHRRPRRAARTKSKR